MPVGLGRLILRATVVATTLTAAVSCTPAQPPSAEYDRQQAVEHRLLPAVIPTGHTTAPWHIPDRMRRYRVPGLSIAVIRNGRVDWTAAYGSTRADAAQPVTTSTVFQAASLSKAVAAVTALSLVRDGTLALDEDVTRRLRSWTLPSADSSATLAVTLRALLSHTAGVTVSGFPGYAVGVPRPTLPQLLRGVAPANSPPIRVERSWIGRYRYSGGGFQVAQLLMEDATGRAFQDLANERVFQPLGMQRSTFEVELPQPLAADVAMGHRHDGSAVPGGWHLYPEQAAASLWSTPSDLARFILGVASARAGEDEAVLSPSLAQQMLTLHGEAIGLGVGLHGEGDELHFDHAGWTRGFRSYFVAYPERGDGVVVMANGDEGHLLIQEVVRAVSAVYGWPHFKPAARDAVALEPSVLQKLAGTYHVQGADLTITVAARDDHLWLSTPRGSAFSFYPSSERSFFSPEDGSALEIVPDAEGRTTLRLWGMTAVESSSAPPT